VITIPDVAWIASYRALACFGPDNGEGSTFVRPDTWLPGFRDTSLEAAEDALLRRYLQSFGPATVADFSAWSVVALKRARAIWARVADELRPVRVDGREAWILRKDRSALERARFDGPTVRLLPYFDSFLMGHKERRHLVDAAHHKRIYRPAGWVYPTVLVDGSVAGEWAYERRGTRLRVRIRPHRSLGEEVKDGVRAEAEDIARFLGLSTSTVSFGKAR